jgi:8-oxo-dGTP pyrophosphatase MutT (NUDIX family)
MKDRYGDLAQQVRVVALCLIRDGDRLLVAEERDTVADETFYLPIGGHIEFGELSLETIRREVREELDLEVTNLRYLGTIENVFTWEGEVGHEIVLLYEGELPGGSAMVTGHEVVERFGSSVWRFPVRWIPIEAFRRGEVTLYPSGALDLLDGHVGPVIRNTVP